MTRSASGAVPFVEIVAVDLGKADEPARFRAGRCAFRIMAALRDGLVVLCTAFTEEILPDALSVLAAALQGRDVRYLRPDPLSGKLVPGADGKIPEYTLGEPNALVTAGTMERGQLKAEAETAVPLNFIGADDAR